MIRLLTALFCLAIPAFSQSLTLGVKGGLRLTADDPPYPPLQVSNSRRYIAGPSVEVGLPLHFAVEVDALYSRLGNTEFVPLIANEWDIRTIINSWSFPVLARYRWKTLSFFAGAAPRHASGEMHTIHYGFYPGEITFSSSSWSAHDDALVAGAGANFRFGRLRLAPEIRYLRWHVPSQPASSDTAYYLLGASPNEAQLLLGIGWAVR